MQSYRRTTLSVFRWVWLSALVFFAAAYLLDGLSGTPTADREDPSDLSARSVGSRDSDRPPRAAPDIDPDIVLVLDRLNQARRERLAALGLRSAPPADWLTVNRRLSLALTGTGLSLEEIRHLESLPPQDRVPIHLERLLRDSRHHDYWAERWTRYLVGADEGPFLVFRRRKFRHWLSDNFAENRRYDQMARDLITAEGLWTDKPQVNFYTVTYDSGDDGPDPIRLAARTSRVFLGLRIDCLQCHDDFLGNVSLGDAENLREGTQQDFHQLASFFTAAKSSGLQGVRSGKADYAYKYLYADEEVDVPPGVPYQTELLPAEGDPRERLARWITSPENRQAARSAVHHVWALLFGQPRGESVDNLPLDEPIDAEIKILVDDLVENGFNLRRLVRSIALSDAFGVDSRADFHLTARHDSAGASFPLVRLRPEQIAGAVIQSSRIKTVNRDSSFLVQLQALGGRGDFVRRYGDLGEDEFTADPVTISQRLVMLNGKLVDESVEHNPVLNASAHVAMFSGDEVTAVENAFLCVLNRRPGDQETKHFVRRIDQADHRKQGLEDLFWALLNSSEFAWNH